jgi:hypothetical protein
MERAEAKAIQADLSPLGDMCDDDAAGPCIHWSILSDASDTDEPTQVTDAKKGAKAPG